MKQSIHSHPYHQKSTFLRMEQLCSHNKPRKDDFGILKKGTHQMKGCPHNLSRPPNYQFCLTVLRLLKDVGATCALAGHGDNLSLGQGWRMLDLAPPPGSPPPPTTQSLRQPRCLGREALPYNNRCMIRFPELTRMKAHMSFRGYRDPKIRISDSIISFRVLTR